MCSRIAEVIGGISDFFPVILLFVFQDLHLLLKISDLLTERLFLLEDHFTALPDGGIAFLAEPDVVPNLFDRQAGRAQTVHQMQPADVVIGKEPGVAVSPGPRPESARYFHSNGSYKLKSR